MVYGDFYSVFKVNMARNFDFYDKKTPITHFTNTIAVVIF